MREIASKSIPLEPGGRWGSILGVFLEQNYMRSLSEIVVLLGQARFGVKEHESQEKNMMSLLEIVGLLGKAIIDVKRKQIMNIHDLFTIHSK